MIPEVPVLQVETTVTKKNCIPQLVGRSWLLTACFCSQSLHGPVLDLCTNTVYLLSLSSDETVKYAAQTGNEDVSPSK